MGVAILSILLTHLNCDLGSFALNRLALCCQGGVDAFFFMSGFGLYYSAQKGHSTLTFYKRRALRIFPPFLCLFATMMLIQHNFTWQRAFWGGTTLAYWFPATRQYMFGWFVSVIVLLYAAFPAYSRWFAAQ
ncbi:acyltransferase family protein [Prevotellamassilia timonensis]